MTCKEVPELSTTAEGGEEGAYGVLLVQDEARAEGYEETLTFTGPFE